jgi:signal transduction histidine kinase
MTLIRSTAFRVIAASLVLSAGLLLVGWYDYQSTRRELLTLLVDQAASLRQTVAAAARSGEAATTQVQTVLRARLLDNARLLRELDSRHGLSQALLDDIVRTNRLFRVTVVSRDGQREFTSGSGGPPPGAGRGFGPGPDGAGGQGMGFGQGRGRGAGSGRGAGEGAGLGAAGGAGIGALAERLLTGSESEAVSDIHGSRWGTGWRLAAGVRRSGGGAIVLNVDASEIADLSHQASIEHLLEEIATRAPEIAYVLLEDGSNRLAFGPLGQEAASAPAPTSSRFSTIALPPSLEGLLANELTVGDRPVLEFGGPVDPSQDGSPVLRLGLTLDGLRTAERRTLTRLVLSLLAALALGMVTTAFVVLRQRFGILSEKHALAEAALRRRDRLAAMGELASTVAHEVRNPLNAIGMSVQRLRREFVGANAPADGADQSEQRELLDVLSGETLRINRIVQQFLDYARPPRLAVRRTDLRGLVADVAASLRAFAEARGVSVGEDATKAGEGVVDPDQLRQAIDNLVRNAIDASPSGARVSIRARPAGAGHVIEIEDHGPGIPADVLPRIFDLYFTTKPDGTGVGLAVTHQIVEAHGGTIEVDSAEGRGTRMILTLPDRQEEQARG